MARTARWAGWSAVAVLGLLAAPARGWASEVTLPIQLKNVAGLQPDAIDKAKTGVTSIFERAGIRVVWVPITRRRDPDVNEFITVNILLGVPAGQKRLLAADALGFTQVKQVEGLVSAVIASQITHMADSHDVSMPMLLAAAIAHEIGHVLRPHAPHTVRGIMGATWGLRECQLADQGKLEFLPPDARALREAVAAALP